MIARVRPGDISAVGVTAAMNPGDVVTIGGALPAQRNLISGKPVTPSTHPVERSMIQGNFFGVNATGAAALANSGNICPL